MRKHFTGAHYKHLFRYFIQQSSSTRRIFTMMTRDKINKLRSRSDLRFHFYIAIHIKCSSISQGLFLSSRVSDFFIFFSTYPSLNSLCQEKHFSFGFYSRFDPLTGMTKQCVHENNMSNAFIFNITFTYCSIILMYSYSYHHQGKNEEIFVVQCQVWNACARHTLKNHISDLWFHKTQQNYKRKTQRS